MPDVDLSEIEAFETRKSGTQPCPVKKALAVLAPKDRKLLEAGCARPQKGEGALSNMALEKWLASKDATKDLKVTWQAIRNHRAEPQKTCSCRHD